MCCTIQAGHDALHYAAWYGHMLVVKYLVEKGQAVITTQDEDGNTPVSEAKDNGHTDIADYLIGKVTKKIVMESNMLPFYLDVRGIILKYLQ